MTALDGQALLDHGQTLARRYARRVGPEAAEELKAEAIARALASPPPDGRMEPWLERIYRNLFVDLWRRRSLPLVDGADLDALPGGATPEDEILRCERRRVVRAGLCSLPREARRAVLAKYYREDHDDVAAARLGVAPVTVRTRIHRALAKLRTRVGELRGFLPTSLGRLASQWAAASVAPAMMAALVVAASAPRAPDARLTGSASPTVAAVAAAVPVLAVPEEIPRAPAVRPELRSHTHKPPVTPATSPAVDEPIAPPPAQVTVDILAPDGLTVFAEPEPSAPPCLVEAPTSLLAQIDKMVEDTL